MLARCLFAFIGMAAFSFGCCAASELHWSAVAALWLGSVVLLGVFIFSTAPRPVDVPKGHHLRVVRSESAP